MRNYVLVGPPGSGKGTQAEKLSKKLRLPHISTGEIFRDIQEEDTELGRKVKNLLNQGSLVPDSIVYEIILQKLNSPQLKKGFVFDGFPRTIEQAEWLDKHRQVSKCIFINVSDKECERRMSARLLCSSCKANYNTIYIKPKQEGVCDKCGGKLVPRSDSTPEAIKKRLDDYHRITEPLKKYYSVKGVLLEVNGEQSIDDVFKDVLAGLKTKNN